MEKVNKKSLIIKILFSLLIVLALMIIKSTNVQAAPASFKMGVMDIDGGHGICPGPHPYNFGDYFCINKGKMLVRKINGNIVVYRNRKRGDYYNQSINYVNTNSMEVEQSIAAAYYAYKSGGGTNAEFQNVVWSSGQWSGKNGYVNNLINYNGLTVSGSSNKLYSRAEDWANFYYNLLKSSGNDKLNIETTPVSEDDLRVMVNQPDRIFIQGPYTVNITNSSGSIMNNNPTQYSQSSNIGTLVYNEILGKNVGEDIFQFCKIDKAVATITYTDGSSSTQIINTPNTSGSVKLLDSSGNNIQFPQFGEEFYISVPIPSSESRTVANIQVDFTMKYMSKINGTSYQYQSDNIEYEINNDTLKKWADSICYADYGNNTVWHTRQFIEQTGATSRGTLKTYLMNLISSKAREDGVNVLGVGTDKLDFTAYIKVPNANGEITNYSIQDGADGLIRMKKIFIDGYKARVITDSYTVTEGGYIWSIERNDWVWKEDKYTHTKWKYKITDPNDSGKEYSADGYDSEADARAAGEEVAEQLGQSHYERIKKTAVWWYNWAGQNPTMLEDMRGKGIIQPVVIVELSTIGTGTGTGTGIETSISYDQTDFHLIGTDCTVELGGKVWEDIPSTKENTLNGKIGSEDKRYGGMLVELHLGDRNGKIVASTTTNSDGTYHFDKLNALEKYTVVFTFNGQLYQQTYYKDNLSGGYSNAQEIDREGFNDRFDRIDSSPNNYNLSGWHTAYGENVKLRDNSGNYISKGKDKDGNNLALTYIDAWNQFVAYAQNDKSYNSAYNDLYNWLNSKGVGTTDRDGVIQYIKDCMISANTRKYPVYDYFVIENIDNPSSQPDSEFHVGRNWNSLYISKSDQSRNVDFGINKRDTADLALQKDVYKTTVRVNGKTQTYMYNKKDANIDDDGTWNITVRQSDYLYNGNYKYNREIRKSEYLYDGSIYADNGGTSAKDLQVYVTYRIVVRNQSQTYDTVVNEIVDYYDANEYTFDGVLNGNNYTPHTYKDYDSNGNVTNTYINSYVGDRSGNKIGDLTITRNSTLGNGVGDKDLGNGYTPIYLSGITKPDGNNRLSTADLAFVYLTFKVNTHTDENNMPNRVQMDINMSTGEAKGVGKRNLAEINGYSTYYKQGITVPDSLDSNDNRKDKDVSGQKGGSLDLDSSVGNLTSQDLNSGTGDLIITNDPLTNRAEDDTDKAPNIKLVFPVNDDQERVVTGYVFEDERKTASDKATVGNGKYDDGETKINGVTTQLVELVQAVDADGIPTGQYLGEYVWNAKTWDGNKWVDSNSSSNSGSIRYYSGQKETVSPIISGPGATAVSGYTITEDGRYAFKSLPTGDLFVRFIYGDTTQTTLTKLDGEGSEVANLIKDNTVDNNQGYISNEGLNAKSYNGQDYKSTAYQRNLTDNTSVNQEGTYNGINGYINYDVQNYNIQGQGRYEPSTVNTIDGKDKNVMYYYNIGESQVYSGISDAKDVSNIRENVNNYSRGIANVDEVTKQTLLNGRAEVLASALKSGSSNNADDQIKMIKELMTNNAMIAQTGVINTEVEYNTKQTNNQGDKNVISYVIDDVDLGLEERPVSQLKLNKEVVNLKITLADGTIMFDTGKSVTNLAYAKHDGHKGNYTYYTGNKAYRLTGITIGNNTTNVPELITTYMDEELMYGARIEATYKFTVTNIGEVDYLDKQFYYTGKTNNTNSVNIATTAANQIIDYISNNMQYLPTNSNNGDWTIRTVQELTEDNNNDGFANNKNLVNAKYTDTLGTYNTIVTTKNKGISTDLYPEKADIGGESATTQMLLSSTLVPDTGDDSMVYNNLAEIVQTSNTQGRRMKYSIPGNQQMSDQSLGTDISTVDGKYTKSDLITPAEIDADSSQKILILPPTGSDRNYTLWITIGVIIAVLVGGSVFLIKKFMKNK